MCYKVSQIFQAQGLISVSNYCFVCLFVVGEEDELSIKEAAELVVEGMQFKGEVEVSFVNWIFKGLLYVRGKRMLVCKND